MGRVVLSVRARRPRPQLGRSYTSLGRRTCAGGIGGGVACIALTSPTFKSAAGRESNLGSEIAISSELIDGSAGTSNLASRLRSPHAEMSELTSEGGRRRSAPLATSATACNARAATRAPPPPSPPSASAFNSPTNSPRRAAAASASTWAKRVPSWSRIRSCGEMRRLSADIRRLWYAQREIWWWRGGARLPVRASSPSQSFSAREIASPASPRTARDRSRSAEMQSPRRARRGRW